MPDLRALPRETRIPEARLACVRAWLDEQFADSPHSERVFELSSENIELLALLAHRARIAESEARALLLEYAGSANSLGVRAARAREALLLVRRTAAVGGREEDAAGWPFSQDIGKLAALLQAEDPRAATLGVSLARLRAQRAAAVCEELFAARQARQTEHDLRQALQELGDARKLSAKLQLDNSVAGPARDERARSRSYLKGKRDEYKLSLQAIKEEISRSGITSSATHAALCALSAEALALKAQTQPLRSRVDAFSDLPADEALARLRVEQARARLAALAARFQAQVQQLGVVD
jgi:hypothetical protein